MSRYRTDDTEPDVSHWLRFRTVGEWRSHVVAPLEACRAISLVMRVRGVPFADALIHTVEQGSVEPVSPRAAIAHVEKFGELLEWAEHHRQNRGPNRGTGDSLPRSADPPPTDEPAA